MFSGTAYNCSFIDNYADSYGGAMRESAAYNCSFINNSYGGAMYSGTAYNCSFIENKAFYGGAVHSGTAFNCSFIDNEAKLYGGAMFSGTAYNCSFIGNHADSYGGAMRDGAAYNCSFIGNHADYYGGAMYGDGYVVYNSCFINNSAKNGGAAYLITANDCEFMGNNATENGGAMYGGVANDCAFTNNKAGVSGDNTYNTIVSKPVLSVSNFTSFYQSGEKLLFNLTKKSGTPINNANIIIRVYKNNAIVGIYYALSGEGWVVSVDSGSYVAVCSVENQAFDVEAVNTTLTISKASSKVTSQAVTTVYNGGKYLVVTLKDSQGRPISGVSVSVNINGVKTLGTDKNGQIKLSTNKLAPKIYTVKVTFNGNNNYIASTATAKVVVKKATPKITAKKKTFKKSKKVKKYKITLKVNNKAMKKFKLTIKIGKNKFKAKTNSKGKATFKIKKLTKKGKYTAKITYKGNAYYNKVTKKVKIIIK